MARFKTNAVIFDLDGVLCDNSQQLHDYMGDHGEPVDTNEYWADWYATLPTHPPAEEYITLAQMLRDGDNEILVVTGRRIHLKAITDRWLLDWDVEYDKLYMAPDEDGSFHTSKESHLRDIVQHYHVKLAIDDSHHWCDLYRRYDIPTLHVDRGLRTIGLMA